MTSTSTKWWHNLYIYISWWGYRQQTDHQTYDPEPCYNLPMNERVEPPHTRESHLHLVNVLLDILSFPYAMSLQILRSPTNEVDIPKLQTGSYRFLEDWELVHIPDLLLSSGRHHFTLELANFSLWIFLFCLSIFAAFCFNLLLLMSGLLCQPHWTTVVHAFLMMAKQTKLYVNVALDFFFLLNLQQLVVFVRLRYPF